MEIIYRSIYFWDTARQDCENSAPKLKQSIALHWINWIHCIALHSFNCIEIIISSWLSVPHPYPFIQKANEMFGNGGRDQKIHSRWQNSSPDMSSLLYGHVLWMIHRQRNKIETETVCRGFFNAGSDKRQYCRTARPVSFIRCSPSNLRHYGIMTRELASLKIVWLTIAQLKS